MDKFLKNYTIG